MNIALRHKTTVLLRLIALFVLMNFSFASFSHALHIDVESQQVETLDCKLCQYNLDDNKNELAVNELNTVPFIVKSSLKKPFVHHYQFYITPALRAPPIN